MPPLRAHVAVPPARLPRWVENFAARHDGVRLEARDGALAGVGGDGSSFAARLPFSRRYSGEARVEEFVAATASPDRWGVLLVRKGGFAVVRLEGDRWAEHKVGQRHVQGRTKAGGQSQQRFARRRENQARAAYEAAAEHAARILRPGPVVAGGDREAVARVLADPRLAGCRVVGEWLAVPDPRRSVLDEAVQEATSTRVEVENA